MLVISKESFVYSSSEAEEETFIMISKIQRK
jgi:hypothetical protein